MPTKYKPQNNDPTVVRTRVEDAIISDSYNLTSDFFNKYKSKFEGIKDSVDSIISSYGYMDKKNADINNPLQDLNLILYNTIDRNSYQKQLMMKDVSHLSSGARSITTENNSNAIESEIIKSFQRLTEDVFSLMEEYRISVSLIPELKRVLKLMVRDILNTNEITRRSVKDVYKSDTASGVSISEDDVIDINEMIDEDITDKYRIEKNLPIWLYEMLTTGAKPILVMPYKDILKQALVLAHDKNTTGKYSMEDMAEFNKNISETSIEDFESYISEEISLNKLYNSIKHDIFVDKPGNRKSYSKSYEDDKEDKSRESFINSIIDDDIVNNIYENGMEELIETYNFELKRANTEAEIQSSYGIEGSENIFDTVNSIKETIDKLNGNYDSEKLKKKDNAKEESDKVKSKIKEQLEMFVGQVNDNISLVKDNYANLAIGKDKLFKNIKQTKTNKNMVDGMYIKQLDELNEITDNFDKEVLLIELNPENVIPVTIGSEHISYYIYEGDVYNGPTASSSRRTASFAQVVAATGYGNDKGVISAGNGVNIVPNDPAMSSVFNASGFGNVNMAIGGNDIMEGSNRIEILKQIVFKTLAQRMDDVSLVDNKAFQDSIMNLIKQGYIINRKVQFTHVPATNMVYFAHDIDDKGLPHSVLDGTLLQIYMYLAGIVSATLDIVKNASDKEKLEVNMGISNQFGTTLSEIQKNLSTRNIHVKNFFDNIGSVLKNTSHYLRLVIPVVDGEKLYDVSSVDSNRSNPIDTEFINQRLESILTSIPCPPSITNMIKEAEFSRGIINQNIEYRNSVIERQGPVSQCLTKLYRLIALYKGLGVPKSQLVHLDQKTKPSRYKVDIMDLNVSLSPPMYLNMTTIQDIFANVDPVVERYIAYYYGDVTDDENMKAKIQRAKKELIKLFATQIDFSTIEGVLDNIDNTAEDDILKNTKGKLLSKELTKLTEDSNSY